VLGALLQGLAAALVVLLVAIAIGFRPQADPLAWLGALGVAAMVIFALTWLCVAFGLVSKSVVTASNLPTPLFVLPLLGSGFVPVESMPAGLRQFAEYQPFTPVIEALRGLLVGGPVLEHLPLAVGWCALVAGAGYLWARKLYDRDR
jgi:ABC-2 type transport system permease protein